MATKTKKTKASGSKRPPRELWIAFGESGDVAGAIMATGTTRGTAEEYAERIPKTRVVGPYILAERVKER